MTDPAVRDALAEARRLLGLVDDVAFDYWDAVTDVFEAAICGDDTLDVERLREVRDGLPTVLSAVSGAMGALDFVLKETDK